MWTMILPQPSISTQRSARLSVCVKLPPHSRQGKTKFALITVPNAFVALSGEYDP